MRNILNTENPLSNQLLLGIMVIAIIIFMMNSVYFYQSIIPLIEDTNRRIDELFEENAELRRQNEEILQMLDMVEEVFYEAEKIKNYIREKRTAVENAFRVRQIPQEEISEVAYGIVFASRLFNVSSTKITAVAWVETNFDRYAVGRYGEHGLIQVMRSTFNYIKNSTGLKLDFDNWRDTLLAGTIYLRDLEAKYRNYKNRDSLVFAAYNAGPSRAPSVILKKASTYVNRATRTHNEIISKL